MPNNDEFSSWPFAPPCLRWCTKSEALMKAATFECLWLQLAPPTLEKRVSTSQTKDHRTYWLLIPRYTCVNLLLLDSILCHLPGAPKSGRMSPRFGLFVNKNVIKFPWLHVGRTTNQNQTWYQVTCG